MKENKKGIFEVMRYLFLFCVLSLGALSISAISGCEGDINPDGGEPGMLSLGLTDAPTDDFKAVYVTIEEVRVHRADSETEEIVDDGNGDDAVEIDDEDGEDETSSWLVVAEPNTTYNLLELVDGVIEQLGIGELDAGHYTQMRLLLGTEPDGGENILGDTHPFPHYVIDDQDETHELKVPSGYKSGIKLVRGFDIESGVTTELVLDFDASKSVVVAGKKGKIMLKPTIKVLDGTSSPAVSGQIFAGGEGLSNVYISAQIYNAQAEDPRDEVVVSGGTHTDENGFYTLRLEPGDYNLVAYLDGYYPSCFNMVAENNNEYIQEFDMMEQAETETVSLTVDGISENNILTVSIRQWSDCQNAGGDVQIEVTSLSIATNGTYEIILPKLASGENYFLVASTDSKTEVCEWYTDSEEPCLFDFNGGQ